MKPLLLVLTAPLLTGTLACKKETADDRAAERGAKPKEETAPRPRDEAARPTPAPTTPPTATTPAASPDSALPAPVAISLADVKWQDAPAALPKGAQVSLLEGSPTFPAGKTFTMLL